MIIGVLHLKPLPGSPDYRDFDEVTEHAVRNAMRLDEGGVDGILVENFGDRPYLIDVGKETVACMTAVIKEIQREVTAEIGVNVLRNDAIASCAVAKAVKANFIRINQSAFPSFAPEGILNPVAGEVRRYMRFIDLKAKIFADVHVKHVHPASLEDYIEDFERLGADFLVVTGRKTGSPPDLEAIAMFKERTGLPVFAGSGITPENVEKYAGIVDGVIVGSYFKERDEIVTERVEKLVKIYRKLRD